MGFLNKNKLHRNYFQVNIINSLKLIVILMFLDLDFLLKFG
jgi:hypothetical protein